MAETLVVVLLLAMLVSAGLAVTLLSATTLLWAGVGLMAFGIGVGFPAGLYYHVVLHRGLTADGPAPRGWYWYPTRYHHRVSAEVQRRMRLWFGLGAAGFLLIIIGSVVTGLGVLVS